MIKRLELVNIQGHKHSIVDFTEGYNCIIGNSNVGKTTIMRALYWVIYNRPTGTSVLNSSWNVAKDSSPLEPFKVVLTTSNGVLTRVRSKTRNSYILKENDEAELVFDAVKTEVPDKVAEFLRLSDVNCQRQMDPPFLLSLSPPDATKYLNSIVHLDSIDKILALSESERRSTQSELKVVDNDVSNLQIELDKTAWVDEANIDRKALFMCESMLAHIQGEKTILVDTKKQYIDSACVKKTMLKLKVAKEELNNLRHCNEDLELLRSMVAAISLLKIDYDKQKDEVKDFSSAKKYISSFNVSFNNTKSLRSIVSVLGELKAQKKSEEMKRRAAEESIIVLKKSLPEVCPYCGAKLK